MKPSIRKWELLILLLVLAATETLFARYLPTALFLDLALVFALYAGWNAAPFTGALQGMLFGLLQDGLVGLPLGVNGLSKTLFAFGASYLSRWVTSEGLPTRWIVVFLVSILDSFGVHAMLDLLGQALGEVQTATVVTEAAVTAVLGGILFRVLDRLRLPEKDFRHLDGS